MAAFGLCWGLIVAAGLAALWEEEFTPAPASAELSDFPTGTSLPLAENKPTLLLFAHPHCPCTRATFAELSRVLAAAGEKPGVVVVFALPPGAPMGWEQGDLLRLAQGIDNAKVVVDRDGAEAARFKVNGSGDVLLYAATGRLLFNGGITPSRGHVGDSSGSQALVDLLRGAKAPALVARAPVFGCPLLETGTL